MMVAVLGGLRVGKRQGWVFSTPVRSDNTDDDSGGGMGVGKRQRLVFDSEFLTNNHGDGDGGGGGGNGQNLDGS